MFVRWVTFVVWAAVAASALAWGFKLLVTPPSAPAQTATVDTAALVRGDLSRLLGADPVVPRAAAASVAAADARFNLLGVVSPRAARAGAEGVALIAVDGQRPKAYRVGAVVDGDNVLQAVQPRGATLGLPGGPGLIALNLAPPASAATGVLPPPAPPPAPPTTQRPPIRTLPGVTQLEPATPSLPNAGGRPDNER